jgi:GST-like protein
MIDLYFWPTPNAQKVALMLEELGVPYRTVPVDIGAGAQFSADFLKISPNNRIPAIVDHAPRDGGPPIPVFESGAILQYLANKHDAFYGANLRERVEIDAWVFWQVGGVGPMFGQLAHFRHYAPEPVPYAVERYGRELTRLLGVLERRLEGRAHIVGDYSIADIAVYPWLHVAELVSGESLAGYPQITAWLAVVRARPATARGMAVGESLRAGR